MSGAYSIGWKGLLPVRRSGPWGGNYVDNGRVSSTCSVGYESIKTISTGRAVPNLVLETNKLQLWFPKISLIPGFFPPDFRTLITGEVVTHHTSNVGVVKHLHHHCELVARRRPPKIFSLFSLPKRRVSAPLLRFNLKKLRVP